MNKTLRRAGLHLSAVLMFGLVLGTPVSAQTAPATISRVSVSTGESQANGASFDSALNASGRYIAFESGASNLVTGDTNGEADIFVRDTAGGVTGRVSVSDGERQANGNSFFPAITPDGRFIAFFSNASNLVAGDTNGKGDIFVRDTASKTTRRVSLADGEQQANGFSFEPAISADGGVIAFYSDASNLVAGDSNALSDVFVREIASGTTTRVSVADDEQQANGISLSAPAISANGRFVAFPSQASNLVPGDTNSGSDIFVRDLTESATLRVSLADDEQQAAGRSFAADLSADGRFVSFSSDASNLVEGDTSGGGNFDVFVRDTVDNATGRASLADDEQQGNDTSGGAAITADGRLVAFSSNASNLVPADTNGSTDVFVRDTTNGTTARVSSGEEQADSFSDTAAISADGRAVAFSSNASNLVPGDTNDDQDVFVRSPQAPAPSCGGRLATQAGTAGPDVLTGTPGNDVLAGVSGNDRINGGGGEDVICGGPGRDVVEGNLGSDLLIGGTGDDQIAGGPGGDSMFGGPGSDACAGSTGLDSATSCETVTGTP